MTRHPAGCVCKGIAKGGSARSFIRLFGGARGADRSMGGQLSLNVVTPPPAGGRRSAEGGRGGKGELHKNERSLQPNCNQLNEAGSSLETET